MRVQLNRNFYFMNTIMITSSNIKNRHRRQLPSKKKELIYGSCGRLKSIVFGGRVLRWNFVGFWKDCDNCYTVMQQTEC